MSSFQGQLHLGYHVYPITNDLIVTSSIMRYVMIIITMMKQLLLLFFKAQCCASSPIYWTVLNIKLCQIELDICKFMFRNLLAKQNVKNVVCFAV